MRVCFEELVEGRLRYQGIEEVEDSVERGVGDNSLVVLVWGVEGYELRVGRVFGSYAGRRRPRLLLWPFLKCF